MSDASSSSRRISVWQKVFAIASVIALSLSTFVTPALADEGDYDFLTDGSALISDDSFIEPDTSWRVDTSVPGAATVTSIAPDFEGPSDATLADPTGWTEEFSGNEDDDYLGIDLGFSTDFNGESYSSVFIGSNTYFTFGGGSSRYSGLTPKTPPLPGLHMCSGDHSYQLIYSQTGEGTKRIRYEGVDGTFGTIGEPEIVYEVVFYAGQSYFDIHMGINDACVDPHFLPPTISGRATVGHTIEGLNGNWPPVEGERSYSYQW